MECGKDRLRWRISRTFPLKGGSPSQSPVAPERAPLRGQRFREDGVFHRVVHLLQSKSKRKGCIIEHFLETIGDGNARSRDTIEFVGR